MNFDPSLPNDSRRNFVKKSLAASIIAAQPTILAGLIRAQGGGGGTGTTDPWGTTAPGESTLPNTTWATASDTTDPWGETDGETTVVETTAAPSKPLFRKYRKKLYISGSDALGWTYSDTVNNAMPFTNGVQPQGTIPVTVTIPNAPIAEGYTLALYASSNINTNQALKSGFPKSTVTRASFVEPHPNGGMAKGFTILVDYDWEYQ